MQFWTSNVLKSTKHRVQVPKKQRYSLVYFVTADPDTVSPQGRNEHLIILAFEAYIRFE
jgi:isopenicillin N synthase-like dioxygenase